MSFSMTGIGISEIQQDAMKISVEIRSVNNRYLEISCKVPALLNSLEYQIREKVRNAVERGKLYVHLNIQNNESTETRIRVHPDRVKSIHGLLSDLKQHAGINGELSLEHFLHFSELFEPVDDSLDSTDLWEAVEPVLDEAILRLKETREQEGNILVADIDERMRLLDQWVNRVEEISKVHLPQTHQTIVERIELLLKDKDIAEDRLYTEMALLADKMDVTEECVRMRSHYRLFMDTLHSNVAMGKKLTFLLQEMNREANTMSSKASNAEVSHLVVSMKEAIEKIREQVQNLE